MLNVQAISNDNVLTRQLYRDDADCLPYIPAARTLIEKHVSAYWKHDSDDLDYVDMELTLCRYLQMDAPCWISRKLKIKWIARVLNVAPLKLYNDAGLPF